MRINNRDSVVQAIIQIIDSSKNISDRFSAKLAEKGSHKPKEAVEPFPEPKSLKTSKEVIAYDHQGKPVIEINKNILRDI